MRFQYLLWDNDENETFLKVQSMFVLMILYLNIEYIVI